MLIWEKFFSRGGGRAQRAPPLLTPLLTDIGNTGLISFSVLQSYIFSVRPILKYVVMVGEKRPGEKRRVRNVRG